MRLRYVLNIDVHDSAYYFAYHFVHALIKLNCCPFVKMNYS